MSRAVLALMDSEPGYAARFMNSVSGRRGAPFEVHGFTDHDRLKDYLAKRRAEVLLISECDVTRDTEQLPAGSVMVLSEAGVGGEGAAHFGETSWPRISKFQSASAILQEVLDCLAAEERAEDPGSGAVLKPRMKTIGVFSPVGRSGKTRFSFALAFALAERMPTLLLNLESCPGLSAFIAGTPERNISDVIYYLRQDAPGAQMKLLSSIRRIASLSFLPPFRQAEEVLGVTEEEWHLLISGIRAESPFEALVMDLGDVPLQSPGILDECDIVYEPCVSDDISAAKLNEYESMLLHTAYGHVRQKLQRISVPGPLPEIGRAEDLMGGTYGAYARRRIEEDRL